jgi:dTMP kinase
MSRTKRGKFIVLEGGEGSGKTTCLDYLKEALGNENVIFTREPGGTIVSEKIRELIFSKDPNEEMEVETELLLFFAARIQHIKKLIIPALEAGKHVISDRFDLSTYAYQVIARKRLELEESFKLLNIFARGGVVDDGRWVGAIEPDLYILLNVDPEIGLERAVSRRGEITRFDEENLIFHQRVATGLIRATYDKSKAVTVDASNEPDEVRKEVLVHIKNIFGME